MKQNVLLLELIDAWSKRDLRERRILMALAFSVVLSLLYLIAVQPALNGIKNLEEYNPKLKQQAATMTNMAEQYSVLARDLSQNVTPINRELVESTLARRGIKTQSLSVSGDIVRFQANTAPYASLMEWILEMQKASRLTVDEAKLTSLPEAGQVSAVVTLRQQKAAN